MDTPMFCFQCQETAGCKGYTPSSVCGKTPDVAAMQDLLIYVTKGISQVTSAFRAKGKKITKDTNHLVTTNLFATITNANFDKEAIIKRIEDTLAAKKQLFAEFFPTDGLSETALWEGPHDSFEEKARMVSVFATENEDIRSLRELITYGFKGLAAYSKHANVLSHDADEIDVLIQQALAKVTNDSLTVDGLVLLTLETGPFDVKGTAMLDVANTETYGNPEVTEVEIGVRKNPTILISGHDLKILEMLLEQTAGIGVDVYTHSEMLPVHYYPTFKEYSHFTGNYGNVWWQQKTEFEKFNGLILMTTNCIVPPKDSYKNCMWTTAAAGYPGCGHIEADESGYKDFAPIIEQAKTLPSPTEIETGKIVGGFVHEQVFALADKVVAAVKSGAIREFVVMAGCDGRQKMRDYYTEFAEKLPKDVVILTAGCAKYRYNKLNLGDIDGIPCVLDAGQCNDSYSLALITLKLKEIFGLDDIDGLPLAFNIAWYEQKAVIVLLACFPSASRISTSVLRFRHSSRRTSRRFSWTTSVSPASRRSMRALSSSLARI